ncbi:MAG: NADH-quinone oxidoreductase subunit A [Duganella sp.]
MDLNAYLPVLLFIVVGIMVGVLPQVLGHVLGPNKPDVEKLSPYECGFNAFGAARMQFNIKYYLVAILFIIFDLEVVFIVPWAAAFREIGDLGFWSAMFFFALLTVGFVYEWKKGAMDWD